MKLKNGEVRREENIQRVMCEGVCNKCREKLQWRFKYNKYKPLKMPSSCRDCNNKAIHKAYRALCDPCATKRKVCSGCSKDIVAANLEYTAHHKVVEEEGAASHVGSLKGNGINVTSPDEYVVSILGNSNASAAGSMIIDDENVSKKLKSEHSTSEQVMESEDAQEEKSEEVEKSSNLAAAWDERKFNTIANLKYSKDRVVGSTEDGSGGASTVFSFSK